MNTERRVNMTKGDKFMFAKLLVDIALKTIKKQNFEIGQLTSRIQELEYILKTKQPITQEVISLRAKLRKVKNQNIDLSKMLRIKNNDGKN